MWKACIQSEALASIGWLLFSTNNINTENLQRTISNFINDILVSLCWKMISLGTQGAVPEENQVQALHVYIDKMDATMAKPLLLQVYKSNARQQSPITAVC